MKGSHKTQKDNVESQTFTKHHFQNGRSQNTAVDNSELLKIKDYWLGRMGQIVFHSHIVIPPGEYDKNEAFWIWFYNYCVE